jgi:hypothetical protein
VEVMRRISPTSTVSRSGHDVMVMLVVTARLAAVSGTGDDE